MYVCVTKLIPNGFVGKIVKCKLFLRLKKTNMSLNPKKSSEFV